MLYEMLFGPTPFESDQKKKTQLFIEKLEVTYPEKHDLSDETKQILEALLEKDPAARLAHFPAGLSAHPWFLKPGDDLSLLHDLELMNINDLSCFYMEHTNLGAFCSPRPTTRHTALQRTVASCYFIYRRSRIGNTRRWVTPNPKPP